MRGLSRMAVFVVALCVLTMGTAHAYVLQRSTLGAGHGPSTSTGFWIRATAGQSLIGVSDGATVVAHFGYWGKLIGGTDVDLPPASYPTKLWLNHPNPFNPLTVIPFSIGGTAPQHATLRIYDVRGAVVRTLVDDERLPGLYHVRWDGRDDTGSSVATGVYLARLVIDHTPFSRKLLLVK